MDGIVLVDKPRGITSGECVRRVKKALKAERAGHSGSLDGNASGVLLIALGKALDSMPILMGLDKEYEGVVHMHGDFEEGRLKDLAGKFVGKITQTPPKRSAVARRPRVREIYSLEIVKISGRDVHIRTRTQAGVYIRRLAADIGDALGVKAHLKALRRTGLGPFSLKDCKRLEKLVGGKDIMPLERVLERIGTFK